MEVEPNGLVFLKLDFLWVCRGVPSGGAEWKRWIWLLFMVTEWDGLVIRKKLGISN
jgi:hypothetical protein